RVSPVDCGEPLGLPRWFGQHRRGKPGGSPTSANSQRGTRVRKGGARISCQGFQLALESGLVGRVSAVPETAGQGANNEMVCRADYVPGVDRFSEPDRDAGRGSAVRERTSVGTGNLVVVAPPHTSSDAGTPAKRCEL